MSSFSVWIACLIASSRLGCWFIQLSFQDGSRHDSLVCDTLPIQTDKRLTVWTTLTALSLDPRPMRQFYHRPHRQDRGSASPSPAHEGAFSDSVVSRAPHSG